HADRRGARRRSGYGPAAGPARYALLLVHAAPAERGGAVHERRARAPRQARARLPRRQGSPAARVDQERDPVLAEGAMRARHLALLLTLAAPAAADVPPVPNELPP